MGMPPPWMCQSHRLPGKLEVEAAGRGPPCPPSSGRALPASPRSKVPLPSSIDGASLVACAWSLSQSELQAKGQRESLSQSELQAKGKRERYLWASVTGPGRVMLMGIANVEDTNDLGTAMPPVTVKSVAVSWIIFYRRTAMYCQGDHVP